MLRLALVFKKPMIRFSSIKHFHLILLLFAIGSNPVYYFTLETEPLHSGVVDFRIRSIDESDQWNIQSTSINFL